jgi:hypothetical protein
MALDESQRTFVEVMAVILCYALAHLNALILLDRKVKQWPYDLLDVHYEGIVTRWIVFGFGLVVFYLLVLAIPSQQDFKDYAATKGLNAALFQVTEIEPLTALPSPFVLYQNKDQSQSFVGICRQFYEVTPGLPGKLKIIPDWTGKRDQIVKEIKENLGVESKPTPKASP